jgi:hypothetical protein
MWVQHSTWIVQDEGLELAVGDTWSTRLEVSLADAVEVEDSAPTGITLADPAMTVGGPTYDIVARMLGDQLARRYLQAGTYTMAPLGVSNWPIYTVMKFSSEIHARPCWISEPPDPLSQSWEVRQIFIRQWDAVPDDRPNSFRADRSSVRFRAIERMRMWEDEKPFDGEGRTLSDYVLEVV